jgi:hypothetical protein
MRIPQLIAPDSAAIHRGVAAMMIATVISACIVSCSPPPAHNHAEGDLFGSGAPVAPITPSPAGTADTEYQSHAVLDGGIAYIGNNRELSIVDATKATRVAVIHSRGRPLSISANSGGAPVLTSNAGSTFVLWPFVVAGAGGRPAVELTSIHTDTRAADHVIVRLPVEVLPSEPSLSVTVIGASGSTVVLDVGELLTHTAIAIDFATGKPRWIRPNFSATMVNADSVVGTEAGPGSPQADRLSAVSVSTGQPVWTQLIGRRIQAVSAGPLLIAVTGQVETPDSGGSVRTELRSAETGALVTNLPITLGDRIRCLYDDATVTVCTGPVDGRAGGRTAAAFDAQTGHPLWSMPTNATGGTGSGEAPLITAAWHGHIYATDTDAPLDPDTTSTVTNGQPADVSLPVTATSTTYQARSGVADGSITGPVPVLVDDQACLAAGPEHTQIVARPRITHD